MFNYDGTPGNEPDHDYSGGMNTYRPDLVPLIKQFLAQVSDEVWKHFVCFRSGGRGEFVVKFLVPNDRGIPRLVEVLIDQRYSEIVTDSRDWTFDFPLSLKSLATLQHFVNTY